MPLTKKQTGKKVLYFLKGPNPTKEESADADKIAGNVLLRNGSAVSSDASLEPADVVAGHYPARYEGVAKCMGKGAPAHETSADGPEEDSGSGEKIPSTIAELKAALDVLDVDYTDDDKKDDLKALYEEATA